MLLYKLDQFRCEVMLPPAGIEGAVLLNGHVRTFCLWKKNFAYMPPLLVKVAYIPPEKPYCHDLRKVAWSAIPEIVDRVSRIQSGSQHVIVAYVNAPDGLWTSRRICTS